MLPNHKLKTLGLVQPSKNHIIKVQTNKDSKQRRGFWSGLIKLNVVQTDDQYLEKKSIDIFLTDTIEQSFEQRFIEFRFKIIKFRRIGIRVIGMTIKTEKSLERPYQIKCGSNR